MDWTYCGAYRRYLAFYVPDPTAWSYRIEVLHQHDRDEAEARMTPPAGNHDPGDEDNR